MCTGGCRLRSAARWLTGASSPDRVLELWQKYDAIAKEKKQDSFFFANSGGNVRGGPNLDRLGKVCAWFQGDNQGRTYEDAAVWGCSLQGRVCNAVLDGKIAANVTAGYSTGAPGWRNASKNPGEIRMWFNETLASGMTPYYHFVGADNGSWRRPSLVKVGVDYFGWTAKHDAHFNTRRSIANIGVVIGQSTQLLYPGQAARAHAPICTRPRKASTMCCFAAGSHSTLCMKTGSSWNGSVNIARWCCRISPC